MNERLRTGAFPAGHPEPKDAVRIHTDKINYCGDECFCEHWEFAISVNNYIGVDKECNCID